MVMTSRWSDVDTIDPTHRSYDRLKRQHMAETEFRKDGRGVLRVLARCSATLGILLLALAARATEIADCHVGTYRMSDDSIVDIGPSEGNTLRWRRFDGTSGALTERSQELWSSTFGWTGRPDGRTVRLPECAAGRITFDGKEGHRVAFDVTDTTSRARA
jgi:hypothetical protein